LLDFYGEEAKKESRADQGQPSEKHGQPDHVSSDESPKGTWSKRIVEKAGGQGVGITERSVRRVAAAVEAAPEVRSKIESGEVASSLGAEAEAKRLAREKGEQPVGLAPETSTITRHIGQIAKEIRATERDLDMPLGRDSATENAARIDQHQTPSGDQGGCAATRDRCDVTHKTPEELVARAVQSRQSPRRRPHWSDDKPSPAFLTLITLYACDVPGPERSDGEG
jgi:hypothetical protein